MNKNKPAILKPFYIASNILLVQLSSFSLPLILYSFYHPFFVSMFLRNICNQTSLVLILTVVSLLSLGCTAATAPPSLSLFPLEIFGSQEVRSATSKNRRQQAVLKVGHDNPRFSNSSFPGDETGSSPFFYCPESNPDTDIFKISKIVLNPNLPHINYVFVFHAHGYFREAIIESKGVFRVRCTVRNEDREGLDFTFERDFCDFVDKMEMDGKSTIVHPSRGTTPFTSLSLWTSALARYGECDPSINSSPLSNPSLQGYYSVKIDVRGNNKRVFCVQSWFELTRSEFNTL